jgi:hypothetical protein
MVTLIYRYEHESSTDLKREEKELGKKTRIMLET